MYNYIRMYLNFIHILFFLNKILNTHMTYENSNDSMLCKQSIHTAHARLQSTSNTINCKSLIT